MLVRASHAHHPSLYTRPIGGPVRRNHFTKSVALGFRVAAETVLNTLAPRMQWIAPSEKDTDNTALEELKQPLLHRAFTGEL